MRYPAAFAADKAADCCNGNNPARFAPSFPPLPRGMVMAFLLIR
ncbi:hypothetical protein F385_1448 [Pantoea agglomerans 299R]|nr:hypothetical protein F385_1448 [Pantoea agglomerans 299R]